MAKPWAKLEIGYLGHPKFLALNANAICLWHEGKNYCDSHQTDGLIPRDALKMFRFRGVKSVTLLLATCPTPKPDGSPYAPLWEDHPVGYKMHDYLDHNDCRDEVLARIEQADERRDTERQRKADWRAKKKEKRDMSQMSHGTGDGTETSLSRSTTETPTATASETGVSKEQKHGEARPRPGAPIHDRSHMKHALCGRVCLHAEQFGNFVRRRNVPNADQEIRTWAAGVIDEWTTGAQATTEPGDEFDFWRSRYAERWPATTAAVGKAWAVPRSAVRS